MDSISGIFTNVALALLGAGVMALVFFLYLIPKRDALKEAINKANFFKLLKEMERQRKEHELAMSRTKADYEEALKVAKKRDPVEVMNEVARGL